MNPKVRSVVNKLYQTLFWILAVIGTVGFLCNAVLSLQAYYVRSGFTDSEIQALHNLHHSSSYRYGADPKAELLEAASKLNNETQVSINEKLGVQDSWENKRKDIILRYFSREPSGDDIARLPESTKKELRAELKDLKLEILTQLLSNHRSLFWGHSKYRDKPGEMLFISFLFFLPLFLLVVLKTWIVWLLK